VARVRGRVDRLGNGREYEMTEAARGVAEARDGGKAVGRSHAAYCAVLSVIEGGIRFAIPPYGLEFGEIARICANDCLEKDSAAVALSARSDRGEVR
jgi:hypothetical protein